MRKILFSPLIFWEKLKVVVQVILQLEWVSLGGLLLLLLLYCGSRARYLIMKVWVQMIGAQYSVRQWVMFCSKSWLTFAKSQFTRHVLFAYDGSAESFQYISNCSKVNHPMYSNQLYIISVLLLCIHQWFYDRLTRRLWRLVIIESCAFNRQEQITLPKLIILIFIKLFILQDANNSDCWINQIWQYFSVMYMWYRHVLLYLMFYELLILETFGFPVQLNSASWASSMISSTTTVA